MDSINANQKNAVKADKTVETAGTIAQKQSAEPKLFIAVAPSTETAGTIASAASAVSAATSTASAASSASSGGSFSVTA